MSKKHFLPFLLLLIISLLFAIQLAHGNRGVQIQSYLENDKKWEEQNQQQQTTTIGGWKKKFIRGPKISKTKDLKEVEMQNRNFEAELLPMTKEKVEEYDERFGEEMSHLSRCAYALQDIFLKNAAELANATGTLVHCVNAGPKKKLADKRDWDWTVRREEIKWQKCDKANNYCVWYLAFSTRRKRIAIVFRGTDSSKQLMEEVRVTIRNNMTPFEEEEKAKVNPYFDEALNNGEWLEGRDKFAYPLSIWQSMIVNVHELHALVEKKFPDSKISLTFTGHSLGGALAALAAAKLAHSIKEFGQNLHQKDGLMKVENHNLLKGKDRDACKIGVQLKYLHEIGDRMRIELYTFGQPRLGNKPFADIFNKLVPRNFRIVHGHDLVPHVPPCEIKKTDEKGETEEFCNPEPTNDSSYFHHGIEIWYPAGMEMEIEQGHEFEKCAKSESDKCSNKLATNKCIQNQAWFMIVTRLRSYRQSIQNHLNYFGQTITTMVDAVHLTGLKVKEDIKENVYTSIKTYLDNFSTGLFTQQGAESQTAQPESPPTDGRKNRFWPFV